MQSAKTNPKTDSANHDVHYAPSEPSSEPQRRQKRSVTRMRFSPHVPHHGVGSSPAPAAAAAAAAGAEAEDDDEAAEAELSAA